MQDFDVQSSSLGTCTVCSAQTHATGMFMPPHTVPGTSRPCYGSGLKTSEARSQLFMAGLQAK